ncbi:MAG TPA: hypothetical protein VEP66_06535 [Myxococcales bacterium]|nr:hypothetical protein [Myxococcales bacterium]
MPMPARRHLYIPVAILVAGWTVGIAIYLSALDDQQLPFELTDASKLYVYRLQQLGGKFAVMYQEMNDFLASLWHGSRLGLTIGVLSSLLALGWFLLAPRK